MHALLLVVALFSCLILAGCGGRPDTPPGTQMPIGTVLGQALDPAGLPVADATVSVLLTALNATTDASGIFALHQVPAGPARMVASKAGFSTSTRTGEVSPDHVLFVAFTLAEVRSVEPYNLTQEWTDVIGCGLPGTVPCGEVGSEVEPLRFAVDPNLRGLVLELSWQAPAEGIAQTLAVDVLAASAEACGEKYAGGEGSSVLRLVVSDGFPITGGHQCISVRPGADATTVQQQFTLYVSLFYHEPPPEGFTAVP